MAKAIPALFLLVLSAAAQVLTEPPTFIRVIRNWSRPAAGAGLIRPYADAQLALTVFGLTSISGLPEAWLIETHDSFAGIEEVDQKLSLEAWAGAAGQSRNLTEDDILGSSRVLIGLHLPSWSYRPDQAARNITTARYFHVTLYKIRPGTDSTFAELVKLRRQNFDNINLDRPEIAYRIISGAASGTYVFLAPLTSLRMMDNGLAKSPAYAEAMTEGGSQSGRKLAADTVESRDNLLLRVQPGMSYVTDEFAAADQEFWRGKAGKK